MKTFLFCMDFNLWSFPLWLPGSMSFLGTPSSDQYYKNNSFFLLVFSILFHILHLHSCPTTSSFWCMVQAPKIFCQVTTPLSQYCYVSPTHLQCLCYRNLHSQFLNFSLVPWKGFKLG